MAATAVERKVKYLKHLVILKFKEDVVVEEVVKDVEKLVYKKLNHTVTSFEWVPIMRSEDILKQAFNDALALSFRDELLREGFTHIFSFTFRNPDKFNSYQAHPTHFKFADMLGRLIQNVRVLDFTTVMVKKPTPPPDASIKAQGDSMNLNSSSTIRDNAKEVLERLEKSKSLEKNPETSL